MSRVTKEHLIDNIPAFKEQLLEWTKNYPVVSWLDSNEHIDNYSNFDVILAVGEANKLSLNSDKNAFNLLEDFYKNQNDFLFGFLTYDLKNDIENLTSSNLDRLYFPSLYFFQPKKIIFIQGNKVTFTYLSDYGAEINSDIQSITNTFIEKEKVDSFNKNIEIKQRISSTDYLKKTEDILKHLHRGDIYEVNFCMEFYVENHVINPLQVFKNLNQISSPPFASFFKLNEFSLSCASPERYLKKSGQKIISQPIKGTIKRGNTLEDDKELVKSLENNPKERAENIMIVDLVRNDLSKKAIKGSVIVDELCKVYSFKQVHQLISTISSAIPSETSPITILKNTFPMGSMTGAPKISAMKIIEEIEETKRGLYSGAVGYITPDGDFDFNVVIRSILHNSKTNYTSFSVGSAITALSKPQLEYEECLLKGKAMQEVLADF